MKSEFKISKESKVVFKEHEYNYIDIEKYVSCICDFILENQNDNAPIGIYLPRNEYVLFSMLACLELKVPYVLLDTNNPPKRTDFIINDCNISTIITTKNIKLDFKNKKFIYIEDLKSKNNSTFNRQCHNSDIAYIIYTSGTTGQPKGVEILRSALINFIIGIKETIDFSGCNSIASLTTPSFDIFFLETIVALIIGLEVVLSEENESIKPKLTHEYFINNIVDILQITPSRLEILLHLDNKLECLKNIKVLLIGGEQLKEKLLRTLQEKLTARIYNLYGPTETTIWSSIADLTRKEKVTIGFPIRNTDFFIISDELTLLPDGEKGEICISGDGLAKGYISNIVLTEKWFVYINGIRVYRTGDIGQRLSNGEYLCFGRNDNQIKIRGLRIELGEIENRILNYEEITGAVVLCEEDGDTKKIIGFLTSNKKINLNQLKEYLLNYLPEQMLPAKMLQIDAFPMNRNGKVDRNKLIKLAKTHQRNSEKQDDVLYSDGRDEDDISERVVSIIRDLTEDHEYENINTNFIEMGFDSMQFVRMFLALELEFDFQFENENLEYGAFLNAKSLISYIKNKLDAR